MALASTPCIVKAERRQILGKPQNWPFALLGLAPVCGLTWFRAVSPSGGTLGYTAPGPLQYGYPFLSGALAISAMALPGVSGSSLLLIMEVYQTLYSLLHSNAMALLLAISGDAPPTVSTENHRLIGELFPIPAEYTQEASEQGKVVRLDYTTADYANPSRSLEKYACIHLPYGFNAADPEARYDVLYLLHGGGGNAERSFNGAG